ncbi:hypothetical protein B0H19DRAFT_1055199 [Mycena capillaripes]|nr:hypothetical protein B0H19DRAFT_1055199 [Mycena capillaripes]
MSDTQLTSPFSASETVPSFSSETSVSPTRTLRERCGFTLFLFFAPAFPNIPAKGHLGPTAGNLPRRKRSSVVSFNLPVAAPVPIPDRKEYFRAISDMCYCIGPQSSRKMTTCVTTPRLNLDDVGIGHLPLGLS